MSFNEAQRTKTLGHHAVKSTKKGGDQQIYKCSQNSYSFFKACVIPAKEKGASARRFCAKWFQNGRERKVLVTFTPF